MPQMIPPAPVAIVSTFPTSDDLRREGFQGLADATALNNPSLVTDAIARTVAAGPRGLSHALREVRDSLDDTIHGGIAPLPAVIDQVGAARTALTVWVRTLEDIQGILLANPQYVLFPYLMGSFWPLAPDQIAQLL